MLVENNEPQGTMAIQIRVDAREHAALLKLSRATSIPMSALVRQAVRNFMADAEERFSALIAEDDARVAPMETKTPPEEGY